MRILGGVLIRFVNVTKYEGQNWFVFSKDLINVLFNFNSLVNPMVYFLFTRHFKDLRVRILLFRCIAHTGPATLLFQNCFGVFSLLEIILKKNLATIELMSITINVAT